MRRKRKGVAIISIVVALAFISGGCTTALRNKQLESVAKDWSLVVRASQVIPVYPLTEDLQPGDVLLVQTPIEEQVRLYKDKGYLPLDQMEVRLHPKDFYDFYDGRYGIAKEGEVPPAQWQAVDPASHSHSWGMAPHAAFPTYQFSAKTGSGLNLAIPIQGVPFALGLMNSGSASGTVTIANAYTYGLDNVHLEKVVRAWALQNRSRLRAYEPTDGRKYYYLRVISRVYVVGSMNVTLNNDEATGVEAAAGKDRPVALMGVKENATAENYSNAISAINDLLEDQLPGVKAKIATASRRSVTLVQDFDRPLVIGYLGFDMPILEGGRLGAPISTLAQLSETKIMRPREIDNTYAYRLAALAHVYNALMELVDRDNPKAEELMGKLNKLSDLLPDEFPFTVYHQPAPGAISVFPGKKAGSPVNKASGFGAVVKYLGYADSSAESIRNYMLTAPQNTDKEKLEIQSYKRELQRIRVALDDMENKISGNAVLMETIDFVFFGNE